MKTSYDANIVPAAPGFYLHVLYNPGEGDQEFWERVPIVAWFCCKRVEDTPDDRYVTRCATASSVTPMIPTSECGDNNGLRGIIEFPDGGFQGTDGCSWDQGISLAEAKNQFRDNEVRIATQHQP